MESIYQAIFIFITDAAWAGRADTANRAGGLWPLLDSAGEQRTVCAETLKTDGIVSDLRRLTVAAPVWMMVLTGHLAGQKRGDCRGAVLYRNTDTAAYMAWSARLHGRYGPG